MAGLPLAERIIDTHAPDLPVAARLARLSDTPRGNVRHIDVRAGSGARR
jgi:hypothetical protein